MTRALILLGALALTGATTQGCGSSHGSSSVPQSTFSLDPPNGTALPPATTAASYQQAFTVLSGGTPPYKFTPISIPPGLTLAPDPVNGSEAVLSGTPTKMGNATVSFQIVDSTNQKFSNASYTLTVN